MEEGGNNIPQTDGHASSGSNTEVEEGSVVKKLEEMKHGINEAIGRYIKEVKEMVERKDREQKNTEWEDQREDINMKTDEIISEEKVTDTRKREREDEDQMSENISFDLNTI